MAQRAVKDWRTLPLEQWNVRTFHDYFADMNREYYGVEEYAPMRNWRFEQGVLKHAIATHGAAILRKAFDVAFREYRPTREYPLLTAGFAVNYRINTIIPRIKAEEAARANVTGDGVNVPSGDELAAWL